MNDRKIKRKEEGTKGEKYKRYENQNKKREIYEIIK